MQNEDQNKIYSTVVNYIPSGIIKRKNKGRTWFYGYNEKYDVVVISRSGKIGEVVEINGLHIALPLIEGTVYKRSETKANQYWERKPLPRELSRISSIFQWNEMPAAFKNKWVDYIENEFDRRELGYTFYNNGKPTYVTGAHYMYLQWTTIDVGYPDFREANRIFFIYWVSCKADNRCFGLDYLKIRRSGFSFMGSS